jgi:hypothetical protein
VTPEHSDDGVDLTLVRWMLSLTPCERLAFVQDQVDSLLTLRAKFNSQIFGGKVLTRHRIDFIVVGGVSAVLPGAPVTNSISMCPRSGKRHPAVIRT